MKNSSWVLLLKIAQPDVSWVTRVQTRDPTEILVLIDFLFDLFSDHQ